MKVDFTDEQYDAVHAWARKMGYSKVADAVKCTMLLCVKVDQMMTEHPCRAYDLAMTMCDAAEHSPKYSDMSLRQLDDRIMMHEQIAQAMRERVAELERTLKV